MMAQRKHVCLFVLLLLMLVSCSQSDQKNQTVVAGDVELLYSLDATRLELTPYEEFLPGSLPIVRFSPDSHLLATATAFDRIKIWQLGPKSPSERVVQVGDNVLDIAFSSDSKWIAISTPHNVEILKVEDGQLIQSIDTENSGGIAFSNDNSLLATSTGNIIEIWKWDYKESVFHQERLDPPSISQNGWAIKFSYDDQLLASFKNNGFYNAHTLNILQVSDGKLLESIKNLNTMPDFSFMRGSNNLLYCTAGKAVVWQEATNSLLEPKALGSPLGICSVQDSVMVELLSRQMLENVGVENTSEMFDSQTESIVTIWDVQNGDVLNQYKTSLLALKPRQVYLSPDNTKLVIIEYRVDPESTKPISFIQVWRLMN